MLQRCDATHQLNPKCIFLCINELHFELLGARLGSGPRTETEQPFCSVCSVHFQACSKLLLDKNMQFKVINSFRITTIRMKSKTATVIISQKKVSDKLL